MEPMAGVDIPIPEIRGGLNLTEFQISTEHLANDGLYYKQLKEDMVSGFEGDGLTGEHYLYYICSFSISC